MRRPVLILPLVLMTCSSPPAGSLRVLVNVEPGLGSRCARVVARGTGQRESSPVALAGRSSFVIGIAQEQEVQEVTLQAQGYSDEGCTTLSVPPETSELLATRFTTPTSAVMLTLRLSSQRTDGGVDADGDGYGPGLDCDDTNAAIHPAAVESCTNSLDDDCNDLVDCAETACFNEACGVSGQCTDKVCRAPSEAGLCSDNLDNDGDGALDCADSDCPAGQPCSDSNGCTRSDVCGGGSCSGTALVCDSPPARQCFASAGSCGAGGVCAYAVTTGSCNDGLACTQSDTCAADGSCTGTPRVCTSPPGQCSVAVGQCSESQGGTCVYAARTGSCDDQDSCTRDDQCAADGTCAGTRVSCTPPGECFTAACVAGGGCQFTVRTGSCSGGTCNAAGNCVPAVAPFPITPSNFSPAQLPASAGTVVLSCDVTIDTSGASVGWSTCTGGPAAPPSSVVNDVMLLHFDALTIGAGATVRAVGTRPLIIAVRGAVVVDGTLTVSSAGAGGAGSEVSCSSGVGEDGRASGNPQNGGGAGGGGFGSNGGKGGEGDDGGDEGGRGDSNGNSSLTPLRGGCRGGSGGRASNGSGLGGRGGGAVQVTAGTLTVNAGATLSAQGEGGRGGLANERAGGGGGGSGGALFLEAGTLVIQGGAGVVANGGAGGEGSGTSSGGDGQSGQRSTSGAWSLSLTCGGNGGSGGAREDGAGNGRDPNCGDDFPGGGGGGGMGRIRFNAVNSCAVNPWAVISPEASASANCR